MDALLPLITPRPASAPVRVAVGTMNFGRRTPGPEVRRLVARALERGVRLFDTANVYAGGESERLLAAALAEAPLGQEARVATKAGLAAHGGRPEGLGPAALRAAVEASLARLGRERVDLLYLHAPDAATPVEETVAGVGALVAEGKVRAWGASNFASWRLLELMHGAQARGVPPPAASQVLYNLLVRQLDVEYFAFTRAHPLHTAVYNPLAAGLLVSHPGSTAGQRIATTPLYQRRYGSEAMRGRAEAYRQLAAELDVTPLELALGWLARQPGVDSVVLGPATARHLDEALDALETPLSDEAVARVDALHRVLQGTDASYAR